MVDGTTIRVGEVEARRGRGEGEGLYIVRLGQGGHLWYAVVLGLRLGLREGKVRREREVNIYSPLGQEGHLRRAVVLGLR